MVTQGNGGTAPCAAAGPDQNTAVQGVGPAKRPRKTATENDAATLGFQMWLVSTHAQLPHKRGTHPPAAALQAWHTPTDSCLTSVLHTHQQLPHKRGTRPRTAAFQFPFQTRPEGPWSAEHLPGTHGQTGRLKTPAQAGSPWGGTGQGSAASPLSEPPTGVPG